MITITEKEIARFEEHLKEQERSRRTRQKYVHDLRMLAKYVEGEIRDKSQMIDYKKELLEKGYAAASINSMLAAVNQFLSFFGHPEWKLCFLKIQKTAFKGKERELTREEYERLVTTARSRKDERLYLLLQTMCATGIRVGEVRGITVEALRQGRGQIYSKGKLRQILIPGKLCRLLLDYCKRQQIRTGEVFVTKNGRPLDRSNIWKMMKRLAEATGINSKKVFPHNLRHLFACTYYKRYKDIVRLADIMGHSCVDTTRIYTSRNGEEQQRQIGSLCLLVPDPAAGGSHGKKTADLPFRRKRHKNTT